MKWTVFLMENQASNDWQNIGMEMRLLDEIETN